MNSFKIKVYALLVAIFVFSSLGLEAQRIDDVSSILSRFKNYRFGAVNVYKITTPDEIKEILETKRKKKNTNAGQDDEACLKNAESGIKEIVEKEILAGNSLSGINRAIIVSGRTPPDDIECIYNAMYATLVGGGEALSPKAYLVTSRPEKGGIPDRIIGMIYMEQEFDLANQEVREDLEFVSTDNVFSYDRLKEFDIDPAKYGYANLYDLTYAYLIQGNFENETMAARAIGTDVRYLGKEYGVSQPLINDNRVTSKDIQMYKRISQGQPERYRGKNNIMTVSPDLISWTQYEQQFERKRDGSIATDSMGNKILDSRRATNDYLPNFGVELKYGIEGINYPSFWSNRMTLSAIWKNVKFGLILPTEGWSSFSEDVYNQQRTMTYGGVGVSGVLDFPFAIIPRSDVFQVQFGYVFGDAEPGNGTASVDTDPFTFQRSLLDNDYLMRFNTQVHYTFGISVDEDYFMRFSVGGTGYSMETWGYEISEDLENPKVNLEERGSEFIGGISGKLEFMTTNNTTPFGGGIQYFDESLQFNGWVQVPVVDNTFSIRLEANGYAVAFRKSARPWEMNSLLVPMARLIYVF
ncbi:MAG: hypothetical protein R2863_12595 [Candidatus Kapaibacterium sp.]|nr:hypothetical protein [Ignavibacteriota bacterium]MCB9221360.1 hypothetical protein [Ignavibacteria bacterium]